MEQAQYRTRLVAALPHHTPTQGDGAGPRVSAAVGLPAGGRDHLGEDESAATPHPHRTHGALA